MREILFRAKHIHTFNSNSYLDGQWVEGFLSAENYINDGVSDVLIDPNTICQYTGLTDKNGNKIWENDVVKTYNSQGQECHIEKIIWADYGLNEGWCSKGIKSLIKYDKRVFNTGFGKTDARKCEVIGNIFDNPDLLEGE